MNSEAREETTGREAGAPRLPAWLIPAGVIAAVVGAIAWAIGLGVSANPEALWAVLLVNVLYWTGLAQAGVMWGAVLRLARAGWAEVPTRISDACVAFLPLSLVGFAALFAGSSHVLPWLGRDVGDRAVWLNLPFVLLRDGIGLLLMTALSLYWVRLHLAFDAGTRTREQVERPRSILSVALPAAFTVAYSFLAFDLVMSLTPFWNSTLIGLYFIASMMYPAMAVIILLAASQRGRPEVAPHMQPAQWLDVGNLMMTFGMLTTYMFFAQLIVIYYENLPKETNFIIARFQYAPWYWLSWAIIIAGFLGPFVLMVRKEVKMNPRSLSAVAAPVVAMMLVERFVEVVPSLAPANPWPGIAGALLTLGFAGAFVASVGWFLRRYPLVSQLDIALRESREPHPVLLGESPGKVMPGD